MWDLTGLGLEPVSPALSGGFLTTAPPGKSQRFGFQMINRCGLAFLSWLLGVALGSLWLVSGTWLKIINAVWPLPCSLMLMRLHVGKSAGRWSSTKRKFEWGTVLDSCFSEVLNTVLPYLWLWVPPSGGEGALRDTQCESLIKWWQWHHWVSEPPSKEIGKCAPFQGRALNGRGYREN